MALNNATRAIALLDVKNGVRHLALDLPQSRVPHVLLHPLVCHHLSKRLHAGGDLHRHMPAYAVVLACINCRKLCANPRRRDLHELAFAPSC